VIDTVTGIYVDTWDREGMTILFHNSSLTQSPSKEDKLKYFHKTSLSEKETKELIKIKTIIFYTEKIYKSGNEGFCRVCNSHGLLYPSIRTNSFLSNSRTFVNFHHGLEDGIMLCPICIIKVYLVPLAVYKLSKFFLIQPNSYNIKSYIRDSIIEKNWENHKSLNPKAGLLRYHLEKCNKFNAMYYIVHELTMYKEKIKEYGIDEHITIWYFTNYNEKPDIEIINLTKNVFSFLGRVFCESGMNSWIKYINYFYFIDQDKYPYYIEKDAFINNKDKVKEHRSIHNIVISALMNGKSILEYIKRYNATQIKNQRNNDILLWDIITLYIMEVMNMQPSTLKALENVGDRISEIINLNRDSAKKILTSIRNTNTRSDLIGAIEKIQAKHGTFSNYLFLKEILFPLGQYWLEVRNLLLIYIYEKINWTGVSNTSELLGSDSMDDNKNKTDEDMEYKDENE
jgi:CRISPR-associated protein Cst1